MKLPTGCSSLDDLLGGGVESGTLSLLFGEAGSGKTNFCLQLACRNILEGRGKVIYLDTEGISLERLGQIAGPQTDRVLKEILFFSPQSLEEQEKAVKSLEKIASPGLVVVDSINMHYRLALHDGNDQGSRALTHMMGDLLHLTRSRDIPGVITGQVYGSEDGLHAFGGLIMEHIVKTILRLDRLAPGSRRATLLKHRSLPEGRQVEFFITQEGITARPTY